MKTPPSPSSPATAPPPKRRRAFSLVEVTLALGIVTFALVGVVGVLPTALSSGRQSFDQNRAAAIANTLFASFRSQPFNHVGYVDAQFGDDGTTPAPANPSAPTTTIDLNLPGGYPSPPISFYAKFLSLATDTATSDDSGTKDNFGTQRRLAFSAQPPLGGADYRVALNFYDQVATDGTVIPANRPEGMVTTGQACRVELVINSVSKPDSKYRFVSTVVNRSH